jgi:hypothetical protein
VERSSLEGGRPEFFTAIDGDPAIHSAALGLLAGVGDPVAALKYEGEDWSVWCAVTEEALKLIDERDVARTRALINGIGGSVGHEVARLLAQAFRP